MKENRKICISFIICLFVLFFCFALAVGVGAEKLNIFSVIKSLFASEMSDSSATSNFSKIIFLRLRLPRALLVLLTGIMLGGSGAVFQLFFRNPLAEPGIMGISSGATLGAVVASVFGFSAGSFISPVNIVAFLGALAAGGVVTILAVGKSRRESTVMLLLCGTALGTLYSSISSVVLLTCNRELHSIYTWILGSFNGRGWNELSFLIIPAILSFVLIFRIAPSLDLLSGGEKSAMSLGVEVDKLRIVVLIAGALCVSCAVCAGGTISFVGLIAPHIVRKMLGAKAKVLIPFSMIFGAILLLLADTLARVLIAPSELPAGVITSILGAPFFLSLCLKSKEN